SLPHKSSSSQELLTLLGMFHVFFELLKPYGLNRWQKDEWAHLLPLRLSCNPSIVSFVILVCRAPSFQIKLFTAAKLYSFIIVFCLLKGLKTPYINLCKAGFSQQSNNFFL